MVSQNITINLPLYIKASYELWGAKIEGIEILFVCVKDERMDMRLHQNALRVLDEIDNAHKVLVFKKLNSRSAEALIKKHIAFIVQDKQIYMPFALLELKTPIIKTTLIKQISLSPDADTVLIGYLDNQIENGMMIKEIAKSINRELRATSKALKLLETLEYLRIEVDGRSQRIYFISRIEAYERLKQEGILPIKYSFFAKESIEESVYSGQSALSHYSTLLDASIKTVAVSHKTINTQKIEAWQCDEDEAEFKVEVWDRDPLIFAHSGVVNPIYLLRNFRHDEDERIAQAVEMIENKIVEQLRDEDETE